MIPVRFGVLVLVLLASVSTWAISAEAALPNTFVSIIRSDSCIKTDCINPREYIKLDNSTKSISGKFYYNKNTDEYYRKGVMKNAHEYYKIYSGKLFVFFEPDQSTLVRSHQITIAPSLSEYVPNDFTNKTELDHHTTKRITYQGVYVDSKCNNAIVGAKQNVSIKKVIEHLASDCNTDLENKNVIIEKKTKLNYCGQECQHQKFMKQALIDSKKNLLGNKK